MLTSTPTVTTTVTEDCDCAPSTVTSTTTVTKTVNKPGDGTVTVNNKVIVVDASNNEQTTGGGGINIVLVNKKGDEYRTVTNDDGSWELHVEPGDYTLRYEIGRRVPEGNPPTPPTPIEIVITADGKITPKDPSNPNTGLTVLKEGTVGDRVWNDENGNGKQDDGEKGVPNVVVRVTGKDESFTAVTDRNGNWTVDGLIPGKEYEVSYVRRDGWTVTGKVPGAYDQDGLKAKFTLEPGQVKTDLDLGLKRGEPTNTTETSTVTTTVVPDPSKGTSEGSGENAFTQKCVPNAIRSPFLYLAPIAILGMAVGELARPYMGMINEQLNQVNAEIAGMFNRNTPDFGLGRKGVDRDDPFAEIRAQLDAANREMQKLLADPNIQRLGSIAAAIIGLTAAGAVIYDWCTNEPGEAKTASSVRK